MEFQSALLCKEWRRLLGLSQQFSKISIRTPTQGVTISNYIINIYISISIHSPTQGVTCRRNNKLPLPYFNPLSHAGSDGSGAGARSYPCQFQSTLPRWEWRGCWFCPNARDCISIHTPTLGVTRYRPGEPGGGPISIHTPMQGVTETLAYQEIDGKISIHTPMQGVTELGGLSCDIYRDFNPHSHAGSDFRFSPEILVRWKFQSTLPCREWPLHKFFSLCHINFNPHSHAGSDKQQKTGRRGQNNFNPHSHAGSDTHAKQLGGPCDRFQSTPPRREWPAKADQCSLGNYFNPHPHAGSDPF